MNSVKDKVAVVTGGGSGIGRAICILLAKYGSKVVVSDVNYESAQRTLSLIKSLYPITACVALQCDVSSAEAVSEMIARAVEVFGGIDFAVNNAGIPGKVSHISQYPEEEFNNLVQTNLKGVFLSLKYELQQIQKQAQADHYAIVNVSSEIGEQAYAKNAPYAATKHAIIGLTKSTALEYSKSGIRINAVCPAPIDTPLAAAQGLLNELTASRIPIGRIGTPEEVAEAIVWLLSGASSFTTGFTLAVDGGHAKY